VYLLPEDLGIYTASTHLEPKESEPSSCNFGDKFSTEFDIL
jgi:hypothetical protein